MSEDERTATVWLKQKEHYQIEVSTDFPKDWSAIGDEPPPLGEGNGPGAARFLAAGMGQCLVASLLFCLEKSRVRLDGPINAEVNLTISRNERGRFRIPRARVKIYLPAMDENQQKAFERCSTLYEDFCIVTASVRQGIDVDVELVTGEPAYPAIRPDPKKEAYPSASGIPTIPSRISTAVLINSGQRV